MRILQACPYAWDAPGGVQVHVRQLAEELRRRGHEVVVLTPATRRPTEGWVRSVGSPVRVPYNASTAPICPWPASRRRVRSVLERFRPDVTHAHEPLTPSTSMFAVLASAAPVVATFHANMDRARLFDLAAPVLRRVWRRLDARVAVSDAAAQFAASRMGDGLLIVPNGVPVERFEDAAPAHLPPGRRLLFVGRLDRRKGFGVAVDAFSRLATERPDLLLVEAGDGPERAAVARLPRGVRARILMLGAVANEDLPPVYAAGELFLAPSLGGESFGVVLVEAMAAGLPAIASDIAGYREVVRDGIEGMLVPPGDPAALAAAVGRVLDDPALAHRLADAGRARASTYSWSTIADRLEAVYADAISRRRGPPLLR